MFKIKARSIKTRLPLIKNGYRDLHFDEVPILFAGINYLGNRVIGSSIVEEGPVERFFHIIVEHSTYADFINQEVTYRNLLKRAEPIFVLDKNHRNNKYEITPAMFDEIPEEFTPMEGSFCPELISEPTGIYPMVFRGKDADVHLSSPSVIGGVQTDIATIIEIPLARLKGLCDLDAWVRLFAESGQAYPSGSVVVNYDVLIKERQPKLFHTETIYFEFLNRYLGYCLYKLPTDAPKLQADETDGLIVFHALFDEFSALCGAKGTRKEADLKDKFIGDLKNVFAKLQDVSSTIGEYYSEIVLSNIQLNAIMDLGAITESFSETIDEAAQDIAILKGAAISQDETPKPYEIYIYDLNTDSRSGHAQTPPDPLTKKISKPAIKISGSDPLAETKYTRSLYAEEFITVMAKAKKVDGVPRKMLIEFEPE